MVHYIIYVHFKKKKILFNTTQSSLVPRTHASLKIWEWPGDKANTVSGTECGRTLTTSE